MKTTLNGTENRAKEYFESNGFELSKITERKSKTPDFEGNEILVEVKKVTPHKTECLQKDSTYNAIKNNLQDAAKKFRDYDSKHLKKHIVIIFSEDILKIDIYSVWTGKLSPEIPDRIFPSGMLLSNDHKEHIDTIVWFKKLSDVIPKHVWVTSNSFNFESYLQIGSQKFSLKQVISSLTSKTLSPAVGLLYL